MTINTLVFINDLLRNEVERRRKDYEAYSGILKAREEITSDTDWNYKEDIAKLKSEVRAKRSLLCRAEEAYEDYLNKEWN